MGKNTPSKRKSATIANATPIKFPKLSGTPVSKKINNKTPKSANKLNQKIIHGNKSPKSSNKNQKNGKQITPQGRKETKQIEQDESDDESDDSMDEQNGNSDNLHDATDEEVDSSEEQVDEADSDEEADVAAEADSEEEADVAEEADSDEEADVAEEADSDEEAAVAEEADSDEEADVAEEADSDEDADVAEEADSDEDADVAEEADSDEEAEIEEETDNSDEEADSAEVLEEEDEEDDANEAKNNKASDFTVYITGLNTNEMPRMRMENIFPECNIKFVKRLEDENGAYNGKAYVVFRDQKSMTKALEKDKTKIKDSVIRVKAETLPEFCAFVSGFHSDLSQIFQDCNMIRKRILQEPVKYKYTGRAFVYFNDKKSLEKALKKNQIEDNGSKITVELPRNNNTNSNFSVFVKGMNPKERIRDFFSDCSIDGFKIIRHPITNKPTGKAFIYFLDEDSLKKALKKNGRESDGFILTVEPTRNERQHEKRTEFTAYIKNLNSITKLENVFKDCKIHTYNILRDPVTNKFAGTAYVNFEDEENLQKALLKNEKEYDGNVITVLRHGCSVHVRNLNIDSKVEDVFKDCKIQRIINTFQNRTASINFKDKKSFEKALSKNNTQFEGNTITVEVLHQNMNSGQTRSDLKPVRNSNDSENKVTILKKKLLAELRAEAEQLKREIYGDQKPSFHKKKHF